MISTMAPNVRGVDAPGRRKVYSMCGMCSVRVCRAWHRTSEVQVLVPGFRRAEGQEKGKGVIVRWGLKEAQSKSAGRRTGTGYEVWYTRDERARDCEVLHLRLGCAL